MASIDPKYYVSLKGKPYPVFAGVLDAATEDGIKSLTTELVQIPTPDNGHMAIVKARLEFEDGRIFEDYGDASPANCSAQIATAAIRMASTRAKGRVLRDGINLGETLREELPDDSQLLGDGETNGARGGSQRAATPTRQPGDRAGYRARPVGDEASPDRPEAAGVAANGAAAAPVEHWCSECGDEVDPKVAAISLQKFGKVLCVPDGKALLQMERANIPVGQIAA